MDEVENLRVPLLLIVGDQDAGVGMDNMEQYEAKLDAANKDYESITYTGVGHGFMTFDENADSFPQASDAWTATLQFLDQQLAAMADERLSPELIDALGRLKEVPRTGWLDRGIPAEETESVADHSFGVALLAWLLAPDELDRARVIELALLHDLAESSVGDATPYDRETLCATLDPDTRRNWLNQRHIRSDEQRAAKQAAETRAIEALAASLPIDRQAALLSRWNELAERATP